MLKVKEFQVIDAFNQVIAKIEFINSTHLYCSTKSSPILVGKEKEIRSLHDFLSIMMYDAPFACPPEDYNPKDGWAAITLVAWDSNPAELGIKLITYVY